MADELDDKVLLTIEVVDVADTARRLFGGSADTIAGRPMPDHDYRFRLAFGGAGRVTFGCYDTAAHVAEYAKREGWLTTPAEQAAE